jgi:hypothetical protein
MLEYLIRSRKRPKDRSRTKTIRRYLNTIIDGEALPGRGIGHPYDRCSSCTIAPYKRWLSTQIGRDVDDIYADICKRRVYKGNRYSLKEAFKYSLRGGDYLVGDHGELAVVGGNTPEGITIHLDTYPTTKIFGPCPEFFAVALTYYPYTRGAYVQTAIGGSYMWGKGWWGLYTTTTKSYLYELVLDKGRPLFCKEPYEVGDKLIPAGGPVLTCRETIKTTSLWKRVPIWELPVYRELILPLNI